MASLFVTWKCSGCLYAGILVWLRNVQLKRGSQLSSLAVFWFTHTNWLPLDGTKPEVLQRNAHRAPAQADSMRTTLTLDYRKSPEVSQN